MVCLPFARRPGLGSLVGWGLLILTLTACAASPTLTMPPPAVTVFQPGTALPTLPPSGVTIVAPSVTVTSEPAAPTAIPFYGPDTYPDGVNPLTGQIADSVKINRIPVAVKISNFPYSVRPQFGLSLADVVFEHQAEAGLTRFTAVFLQNDAAKTGSIRSARFIDTELAPIFSALLVTSGSSLGTMGHLRQNPWFAGENVWRLVSEETRYFCPPLCRETPDDMNTLFANTETLRAATAAQGSGTRADLGGFAFTANVPGGIPATQVLIDFSLAAHVDWRYNPGGGVYERWQEQDASGAMVAHIDALTNRPIVAANVVVLNVSHVNNFVPEDFRDGGNCGLEIQLWTSGPAKIFRDGMMIDGNWRRDDSTQWKLRLLDQAGNVIPFKPGNTWFDVVGLNSIVALNGATYSVTNKVPDTKSVCPIPPTDTPDPFALPTLDPLATPTP